MSKTLGIVMDPIEHIKPYKDSSFAMMLAAQKRGWRIYYMLIADLYLRDGICYATMRQLQLHDNNDHWFDYGDTLEQPLQRLDAVLIRKDPPFDSEYLYATQLLEQAESAGTLVVNRCQSLRDANEKLFATRFSSCQVPTLVSCSAIAIRNFIQQQQRVVVKPLDSMGGSQIFQLQHGDTNTNVILETITDNGKRHIMAQRYIPEISAGDKRILLINGKPVPYALARIPAQGEFRGNLAAGGRGEGVALTKRDYWICEQIAPTLRKMGLLFVGIDVIGDYLTEINVTSPTCIRELDQQYNLDIAGDLIDTMTQILDNR